MILSMAKELFIMKTEKQKDKKVNSKRVNWKAKAPNTTLMDQKYMKANGVMTATEDKAHIIT